MNRAQSAILPAALFGSVVVVVFGVFVSSLMSLPSSWLAPIVAHAEALPATPEAPVDPAPAAEQQAEPAAQSAPSAGCAISETFPDSIRQWCDLITRHATENGLEPNLVASVMLQESGGNPVAYSKSGAVGLLQVMPRDGLASAFMCKNGPCFSDRPTIKELEDPEFNVSYGTRMLAGLLQKRGDIREALKSYGPMDVGYYYADIILTILAKHQTAN